MQGGSMIDFREEKDGGEPQSICPLYVSALHRIQQFCHRKIINNYLLTHI